MRDIAVDQMIPGLEVIDLTEYPAFLARPAPSANPAAQILFMERLATALLDDSDSVLQWLVDAALKECRADSAGISLEQCSSIEEDGQDIVDGFKWVATAGKYGPMVNAVIPRHLSVSEICHERGRPQLFRVSKSFMRNSGVDAMSVTDGLIFPWETEQHRGTIWVQAHGRTVAFELRSLETLELLARFAALCVTYQQKRRRKDQEWTVVAGSAVLKVLVHHIYDPLVELTRLVSVAQSGTQTGKAKALADELALPLRVLTDLIDKSLAQDYKTRSN